MGKRGCVTRFTALALAGLLVFGTPAEALAAGQPESVEEKRTAATEDLGERAASGNLEEPKETLEEMADKEPEAADNQDSEEPEETESGKNLEAAKNENPEEPGEMPGETESGKNLEAAENENPEKPKETPGETESEKNPEAVENENSEELKETPEGTEPSGDTETAENPEEPEPTGDTMAAEDSKTPEDTESGTETAENQEDTAETLLETVENTELKKDLGGAEKSSDARDFGYSILDDEEKTIEITGYDGSDTEVVIPEKIDGYKVKSIGNEAFYRWSSLTDVEIPEGVTSIGDYAFGYCNSLTNIVIPSSVTSIGHLGFYRCSSLTDVEIPEGVLSIGDYAFGYCNSLTNIVIPSSVTSIGDYAFERCNSLTNIVIPSNVTSIGAGTFVYCRSLTGIKIPPSVTSIGVGAFEGCKNLTSIEIPPSVTSIGEWMFFGCNSLTSIEIPDGVISIGDYAFGRCNSLTSVEIPERVTSIGVGAFEECSSLVRIVLPGSVISIEDEAFPYNDDMIFYVEPGSYAEAWAKDGGRKVVADNTPAIIDISSCTITFSETSVCYTGAEVRPDVTVKNGNAVLEKDADYTISYEDNVNVGTATVTVTGKGNYTGSKEETFTITAKSISGLKVAIKSQGYTGSAVRPAVTVTDGKRTLKNGTDYTFICANNVNAGKAATVTITGKGNYAGKRTETFTITRKSVSGLTVSAIGSRFYTGKSITPAVTVKDGKKILKKGTDYNVSYANNKKTGKATITVTGKGNYAGSKKVTFTILPNVTGVKAVSADYSSVKVSWKKVTGVTGYKVYRANSKNGKYTCIKTIKGAGTVSYKDGKLTTGKTYYYKVRAYVSGQDGSLTAAVSAKPALASASLSSVSNTAAKTATVKWKKVSGASGYEVYSATAKNRKYKKITTINKTGTVSYKNTKLKKGSTYYYKVRAYRTVNGKKVYGGYSATKNVKIKK